jgi:hypothetical protein
LSSQLKADHMAETLDYATAGVMQPRSKVHVVGILMALVGAGVALWLASGLVPQVMPAAWRKPLESLTWTTLEAVTEQPAHEGVEGTHLNFTVGPQAVWLTHSYVTGFIRFVPLLMLLAGVTTVLVARRWRMGAAAGGVLLAISLGCAGPGLSALSGLLQGLSLPLAPDAPRLILFHDIARGMAPMLACAVVALSWRAARWVLADEESPVQFAPCESRLGLWTATGAAMMLALTWGLAIVASGIRTSPADTAVAWRVARYGISSPASAALGAMLILSLAHRRPPRWTWLPLAAMVVTGGDVAGAFVLLLSAANGGDPGESARSAMEAR